MIYVYYNLRLWVKQINKVLDTDTIVLDSIDTMSPWRVETEEPVMEEAPKWMEHDVDELEGEGDEVSEPKDLPLTGETDLEQQEDIESFPEPMPQPPHKVERLPIRGRSGRHPTTSSTLDSLSLGVAPTTSGSASTRPATTTRGKAPTMTFSSKRSRGNH
jgi:hypothetical protein